MKTDRPTVPCPSDQQAPLGPRSPLAAAAIAAGISPDDVRAFLTARYRFSATDCGLQQVSQ